MRDYKVGDPIPTKDAESLGVIETFRVLDRLTGERVEAIAIHAPVEFGDKPHYPGDILLMWPVSPLEDVVANCSCCGGRPHVRVACYGPYHPRRKAIPIGYYHSRFIPIR
jgi:hypothetical protein